MYPPIRVGRRFFVFIALTLAAANFVSEAAARSRGRRRSGPFVDYSHSVAGLDTNDVTAPSTALAENPPTAPHISVLAEQREARQAESLRVFATNNKRQFRRGNQAENNENAGDKNRGRNPSRKEARIVLSVKGASALDEGERAKKSSTDTAEVVNSDINPATGIEEANNAALNASKGELLASVSFLREQKRQLDNTMENMRLRSERAKQAINQAKSTRTGILTAFKKATQARQMVESTTFESNHEFVICRVRLERSIADVVHLGKHVTQLLGQQRKLQRQKKSEDKGFRKRGLEQWVESSIRGSSLASGYIAEALTEGTLLLEDGIEQSVFLNARVAERIAKHVPINKSPFYSSLVTVLVALCPLVTLSCILITIKRRLSRLTLLHYSILGNCYFLLLSSGCFAATILGVDVLVTFQSSIRRLFEFLLLTHGSFYVVYCVLLTLAAISSPSQTAFVSPITAFATGLHFFFHSFAHHKLGQSLHVDRLAYAIYICSFVIAMYQLLTSVRKRGTGGGKEGIRRIEPPAYDLQVFHQS
jgi:hypothetical protein